MDIPEFHGTGSHDDCLDWIHATEELLDFKEVHNDRRVALVATYLCGCASSWWFHLKTIRLRQRKPLVQ